MTSLPSARKSDLDVAENFAIAFDIPDDSADSTIITVEDFDAWALRCGYYEGIEGNSDAINNARNRVRYAINNVATGQPWRDAGGSAFIVRVSAHGRTYAITTPASGYVDAGQTLPRKVESIANTRRKQLSTLLNAVDYSALSSELRIEARTQMRNIDNWIERQDTEMRQMERGFRQLRQMIQQESEQAALLIANHNESFDFPE